jgi:hypothetical protein
MQLWHKGPVPQTAVLIKKRGDNPRDLQEGHRAKDRETNSGNSQLVMQIKKMDLVEGTALSETEKESCTG